MSSILDALKKSERQRGLGRDLIFRAAPPDPAPRISWSVRAALLATLVVIMIGMGLFWFMRHSEPVEKLPSANASSPAVLPDNDSIVASAIRPQEGPTPRIAQDLKTQTLPPARPTSSSKSSPGSGADVARPEQAPWLNSLSDEFRASLPPLVVNIHVYSPVETQRILYINNLPAQQGERIQAGVLVEEIVQDGIILRFRGQRFKIPRPS